MNNKQWQQELQELKLTAEQKQNLKKHVFEQQSLSPKKVYNWPFIIAPTFVVLLVFCVLLIVTDSTGEMLIQQASQPSNTLSETDHSKYFQLHTRLSLAISIGILLNGFMGLLIVMKTKRWQQTFVQKLRKALYKLRFVLILLASCFLYSFTVIASLVFVSEQAKIIVIYLLVILLVYLCVLFAARNQSAHVCCPHCQHEFSRKEKRKLMMHFKIDRHCHKCGGKLFYSKRTRQVSGIMSGIMSALLILPSNFGIPFGFVIICGILMCITILYVLLPLFLELEGEEKPLF